MHVLALGTSKDMDISSPWMLQHMGTFWPKEFLAPWMFQHGIFKAWTFRHLDILAPCKAIWTFWHRHFGTWDTVPKCPRPEMSMVPKNPCAKKSPCLKVLVPKRPRRRNVHVPIRLQGWNMHMPKCPADEMSVPKCQVTQWWEAFKLSVGILSW